MTTSCSRSRLIETLEGYNTDYAVEKSFIKRFLDLLQAPRAYYRDHLPGHVTGSAWIVDSTRRYTLLTHHATLNRWLQPGGHADGDEDIFAVALREGHEETGLTSLRPVYDTFYDIDIHSIPATPDFPEHLHYDVRFLFEADIDEPFTVTSESHALEWVSRADLGARTRYNPSMLRMAGKIAIVR